MGDFNLPGVDWSSGASSKEDEQLVQELQEHHFTQLVDFRTHIKGGCLDLILTNMPEKVSKVEEAGRLGKSDHVIIQFDLELTSKNSCERKLIKNWNRVDWKKIRRGLETKVWPTSGDAVTTGEA